MIKTKFVIASLIILVTLFGVTIYCSISLSDETIEAEISNVDDSGKLNVVLKREPSVNWANLAISMAQILSAVGTITLAILTFRSVRLMNKDFIHRNRPFIHINNVDCPRPINENDPLVRFLKFDIINTGYSAGRLSNIAISLNDIKPEHDQTDTSVEGNVIFNGESVSLTYIFKISDEDYKNREYTMKAKITYISLVDDKVPYQYNFDYFWDTKEHESRILRCTTT